MKRRSINTKKLSKNIDIAESEFETKFDSRGRRLMICSNSVPEGRYWKGHICNEYTVVANDATEVICYKCVNAVLDHSLITRTPVKSDKPKGWKFMKEYVYTDGTVYHKGVEQPALKGTLPVTVIEAKPEKKKMSKQEKDLARQDLGKQIEKLKGEIIREQRKGKKAELTRALSKANKQLKKLL
jgi:hypothetical protein